MKSRFKPALESEFEREAGYLTQAAERYGLAESLMRLRALAEIAEALSTEALLELAGTVAAPAA